eukprot:14067879-Alexandrium_andersonii.AAC.1
MSKALAWFDKQLRRYQYVIMGTQRMFLQVFTAMVRARNDPLAKFKLAGPARHVLGEFAQASGGEREDLPAVCEPEPWCRFQRLLAPAGPTVASGASLEEVDAFLTECEWRFGGEQGVTWIELLCAFVLTRRPV